MPKQGLTLSCLVAAALVACGGDDTSETAGALNNGGIELPPGFSATVFADGLTLPRHMAVADNGDLYVTLRSGQARMQATAESGGVTGLRDTDGDGVADRIETFGRSDTDTGLAIHDGYLYYSSMTAIYAVPLGRDLVPSRETEVAVAEIPESGSGHRQKPITFDAEGHLYTQLGSPSNSCQEEPGTPGSPGLNPCTLLDEHGGTFRFIASNRDQIFAEDEIRYSTGHRNVVALEWNPVANKLYLLMHGRDGLDELWPDDFSEADRIALPAEEFHQVNQRDNLGWPYSYYDPIRGERMVMPEYGGDGETPVETDDYKEPIVAFPGHWAPNDLVFYTGTQFPARYRNGAFIAFHGSSTLAPAAQDGYAVVFVPMNAAGEVTGDWEIFADDFEGPEPVFAPGDAAHRPSGLAVAPDGSLFIGDDRGGRIWRVTYSGD